MLSTVLAIALLVTQADQSVRVEYDRFRNVTTVTTGPLSLKDHPGINSRNALEQLTALRDAFSRNVTASFSYPGRIQKRTPRSITLTIYYDSRSFYSGVSFIALVDGRRIALPSLRGITGVGGCTVPLTTFRKLASGKRVELQIGSEEFVLPAETVRALQEIHSHASL